LRFTISSGYKINHEDVVPRISEGDPENAKLFPWSDDWMQPVLMACM